MRKKIIDIIVCTLLIVAIVPFTAMAGDENDPEIVDEQNDCFGALVQHPFRLTFLQALGILKIDSFDGIDIVSAWFYENSDEPDYLFAAVKLNDLEPINQRAIYSVHWSYNGVQYSVGSHIINNGQFIGCQVGRSTWIDRDYNQAEATYDFDTNIVTFKFSKEFIGNPNPGDVLTDTFAWTALRLNFEQLTLLFSSGELIKDAAPFLEDNKDFGRDYVIQH